LDAADLAGLATSPEPVVPGSGTLRFSSLNGTATLDAGIVDTPSTVLNASAFRIDVKGWWSLASGLIDARATLSPSGEGAARPVPIVVSGTWRHPQFDRERAAPAPVALPRG